MLRGSRPTAVFAANDQMALGLLRALHESGIRVPEDVSVVGFDDLPESGFFTPPLTTVRQDFRELGQRTMALILRVLAGEREASVPLRAAGRAASHRPVLHGSSPALSHRSRNLVQ